jgi:hypothetical protein
MTGVGHIHPADVSPKERPRSLRRFLRLSRLFGACERTKRLDDLVLLTMKPHCLETAVMRSPEASSSGGLRLSKLLAVPSLGADLGMGQPMEHAMRQCPMTTTTPRPQTSWSGRGAPCRVPRQDSKLRTRLRRPVLNAHPGFSSTLQPQIHWL